jgi:murein tripeptide amidase MpaA
MGRYRISRVRLLVVATALIAFAAAQTASATVVFSSSLRAPLAKKRTCEAKLVPGARGVSVRRVTAADTGLLRVRLGARRGDWDIAVFDATTKRLLTASTGFRSREVAEGFVLDGQRLAVQACHRKGRARRAAVGVRTIALASSTETIKLVRVSVDSQAEGTRLASSGFDLTEHGGDGYLDVLAHGAADLRRLREEKFTFDVLLEDVVAADAATLRRVRARWAPGDGTPVEQGRVPAMPSGRVTYRHLWDYTSDMKALLENSALADYVRPVTLAHTSLEGRPVEGIEIAKDVDADDGRPVFLQMGVHHAREWPSGEHAIEFGFDLLNNRDATAVQFADRTVNVKDLLENARTIVVPIVNPDGFNLSREAPTDLQQGSVQPAGSLAYKRKNCRIEDGLIPAPGQCGTSPATRGVDPNRNYGQFWGGPGASGSPTNETYWGAAPFSEPEIQNVRELVSQRHVVALITNHTYSDLVLRPPGLKSQGEPFDEDGYYKPLGDAMAAQNGYASQYGYELYDTTGTTEDWTYAATGGLGFTFEIGKGEGVSLTGAGFHPFYPVGVPAEYFGKGPWALKGNRSAYFLALEFAADTANHSLIEGTAKPGTELRLTKTFETITSPRPENGGQPIALTDSLTDTLAVGGDGTFSWHVNPSTRPMVAKGVPGREVDGRPQSAPRDFESSGTPFPPNGGEDVPGTYEEVQFSIPDTEDNGGSVLRVEYPPGPGSSDLDIYVFRRNANGEWEQIGSSASSNADTNPCTLAGRTGECDFEQAEIPDLRNGEFKLRVDNWASTSTDWVARLTTSAPVADPGIPPSTESYTLTCVDTAKNRVLASRAVTVARGEQVDVGNACAKPKKKK